MTFQVRKNLWAVACLATLAGTAFAQQPNFGPALYGDGALWGSKGTTTLPAPNQHNLQSFDKLFIVVNGAAGQLPVAEAAPGNPLYNGGRWFTHTVMWTAAGIAAHDPLPVLKSNDEIMQYYYMGELDIAPGSPTGGSAPYFQCPMLPVK